MPLGLLSIGESAEVVEVRLSRFENQCCTEAHERDSCSGVCRLEDMGLRAGKVVEMLNKGGGGALLVKVDESRIAIGRGMAMKVMVRRKAV